MADTYTIVSQAPVMDADAAGQLVPSVEIRFTTKPSAQPGKVRVPQSQYSPENVDRIVSREAATIEAVQAL
jgi:hypothetical protein